MCENILNAVDSCLAIAKKYDSLQVIDFIAEEKKLFNAHLPGNILIIGQDSKNLLECVKGLLNQSEIHNLKLGYIDRAFKLIFSHGEAFKCKISQENKVALELEPIDIAKKISNCNKDVVPSVEITLNSDKLKDFSITVIHSCDGFKELIWKKELGCADFAFLLINATAAMNMYERNFLNEYLKHYLGVARIGIVVAGMEHINSLSDRDEIISNVKSIMMQCGMRSDLLYMDNESIEKFIYSYVSDNLAELHRLRDVQIAATCISEIEALLDTKEKEASFDAYTVQELIEEMKLKKKDIMEMGDIAAENARANIKFSLSENFLNEIDSYNEDIVENIKKGIENAEDISKVKDKIPDFIENAWATFLNGKYPWMEDTVQGVLEKIYEEMENDVDEFFVDVSDDKKNLLAFLFENLQNDSTHRIQSVYNVGNLPEAKPNTLTAVSKIMLLSSVPLVFLANPVVGIATAASGIVLKKYNKNKLEEASKEEMLKAFKDICIAYRTEIYNSCCKEFEYFSDEAAAAVRKAYEKFTDNLIGRLHALYENITRLNCQMDEIKQIRDKEIPALKSAVMS